MSNTKGKFYIRLAGAYVSPWYWNQQAQNWMANPELATMFDTQEQAEDEREYAEKDHSETALVLQSVR